MEFINLPRVTLNRLPGYLTVLHRLRAQGRTVISPEHLADETRTPNDTLLADIAAMALPCQELIGVDAMIEKVEAVLGYHNQDAFLIGNVEIARSILRDPELKQAGARIVAAFSENANHPTKPPESLPIMPLPKLSALARRMHVRIGIIATDGEKAQAAADLFAENGFSTVWNASGSTVRVPATIQLNELNIQFKESTQQQEDPE